MAVSAAGAPAGAGDACGVEAGVEADEASDLCSACAQDHRNVKRLQSSHIVITLSECLHGSIGMEHRHAYSHPAKAMPTCMHTLLHVTCKHAEMERTGMHAGMELTGLPPHRTALEVGGAAACRSPAGCELRHPSRPSEQGPAPAAHGCHSLEVSRPGHLLVPLDASSGTAAHPARCPPSLRPARRSQSR